MYRLIYNPTRTEPKPGSEGLGSVRVCHIDGFDSVRVLLYCFLHVSSSSVRVRFDSHLYSQLQAQYNCWAASQLDGSSSSIRRWGTRAAGVAQWRQSTDEETTTTDRRTCTAAAAAAAAKFTFSTFSTMIDQWSFFLSVCLCVCVLVWLYRRHCVTYQLCIIGSAEYTDCLQAAAKCSSSSSSSSKRRPTLWRLTTVQWNKYKRLQSSCLRLLPTWPWSLDDLLELLTLYGCVVQR